jgi:hypothetical protein
MDIEFRSEKHHNKGAMTRVKPVTSCRPRRMTNEKMNPPRLQETFLLLSGSAR